MEAFDDGLPRDRPDPLTGMPDAVFRLDREGRFTFVNRAAETLLERRAEELLGRDARDCFPGVRGSVAEERYREALRSGTPQEFPFYYEQQDRWYELRAFPWSEGLTVFLRDIDAQRRDLARQTAERRELSAVLESLPASTVLVGEDGRILSTNRAWRADGELLRQSGLRPGGVGDDYLAAMAEGLAPAQHAAIVAGLDRVRSGAANQAPGTEAVETFDYEYETRLGSRTIWFRLQAAPVAGSQRLVISHVDVTARVLSEAALAYQARHDDLTGLPNRAALLDLIGDALEESVATRPDGELCTALLVIDLDGFKTVNDSLGHLIGDEVLCQVSARLMEQLRPGDVVGRLGADQFVVLARDCDSAEAAALAFRLQQSFGRQFVVSGISLPMTASIGVAVARPDVRDAHELLSDADAAMFAAKSSGRDRVHLFSPILREAARWRLEVATRLRSDAVDQLVVHYQPVVRLDTGAVEGVEALVRWQHPERGLLPPDAFLAVAEETGQIIPITRWLLAETTRRAAEWRAQGLPLRMSVNVSARHFSEETLVRDVRSALHDSGLPPEQLVLELTETSLAEDPARAEDQLTVLRSVGVRVAIDDFGTGWSSLAQLFALPIGTLKIDRSLLTAAERAADGDTQAVLTAIVRLTRTLGISSVAEGIETPEHLRMVRAAGCDLAQGWLLGQPMPAEAVPQWARAVQDGGGDLCALVLDRPSVPRAS